MIVIKLGQWNQQGYRNEKKLVCYTRIYAGKNKNIWTPFCKRESQKRVKR